MNSPSSAGGDNEGHCHAFICGLQHPHGMLTTINCSSLLWMILQMLAEGKMTFFLGGGTGEGGGTEGDRKMTFLFHNNPPGVQKGE